jgi:acyl-CoA thioester hydrolase
MREFVHTIRVPYADTDKMGFVYYANYLVYFEMARSEMLREAGLPYTELEAQGILLPVLEAHCDYKRPAHYDDLLTTRTRCSQVKGVRLRIEYVVERDGELLASGHTLHVCMSPKGKACRPSAELRRLGN